MNRIVPEGSQSFNREAQQAQVVDVTMDEDVDVVPNNIENCRSMPLLSDANAIVQGPSTSSSSSKAVAPRMLMFKVHYCEKVIPIEVPDTGTVGE